MSREELLEVLSAPGVTVKIEGQELRVKGPKCVLTPAVLAALPHHKAFLLEWSRAVEVAVLQELADSLAARIERRGQVPPDEWEAYVRALGVDDLRFGAGMKRLGLKLEHFGWTLDASCNWQRLTVRREKAA